MLAKQLFGSKIEFCQFLMENFLWVFDNSCNVKQINSTTNTGTEISNANPKGLYNQERASYSTYKNRNKNYSSWIFPISERPYVFENFNILLCG